MIKFITWLLIIFWLVFGFNYYSFTSKVLIEKEKKIYVKSGSNFYTVWKDLELNEKFMKIYLKYNKPDFELKEWYYKIKENSNIKDIINALKIPTNWDKKATILEWWNIYDIDNYLKEKWLIKEWDFIKASGNINTSKYPFLSQIKSLEWFLYPDTYDIDEKNFSNELFIKTMLDNFEKKVYSKELKWKSPKEILEIINLASIVEKEANIRLWWEEEASKVAWILKKRLDENWFLWADATVCYQYKIKSKDCTPKFVNEQIYNKDQYNTRKILWLPKTPISNPSIISIKAVLFPKESPYYYYLHDNDWKIHYARTNQEHIENKNKYVK